MDFSATPDPAHQAHTWSVDRKDGQTGGNTYTLRDVEAIHTVRVSFRVAIHTPTYDAGANGHIYGDASKTATHGSDGTSVTAVPATGYHFADWSDGSRDNPRTDTNVTAGIAVAANFEINRYTATVASTAGGSSNQDGAPTINHGGTLTIAAAPDYGYRLTGWNGDASGAANPLTVAVTSDTATTANSAI